MSNVVSAAIVSGELIIGLDDGSIIRAGYVQGPQGLKGDQGPMGATGARGTDGSTIHTVKGPPPADLGKDGDYAINNRDWFIFGPKASGLWGAGQGMLPKQQKPIEAGKAGTTATGGGGGSGGSGGGGGPVFTNTVIATGAGRLAGGGTGTATTVNYPGSPLGMIPPEAGMNVQSNINAFFVNALEALEVNIPVVVNGSRPTVGVYEGMLWYDSDEDDLTLYVYYNGEWVPAAPPVSLDGIETSIANIDEELLTINANVAINKSEVDEKLLDFQIAQDAQDARLDALEGVEDPDLGVYVTKAGDNTLTGANTFSQPIVVAQGASGSNAATNEQLNSVREDTEQALTDFEDRIDALEGQGQGGGDYVKKSGDEMTGNLHILKDPVNNANINTVPLVVTKPLNETGSLARFRLGQVDVVKINNEGQIEMEGNRIIELAAPTSNTDAATKGYADGVKSAANDYTDNAVSNAVGNIQIPDTTDLLKLNGTRAMTGVLNMGNNKIGALATPVSNTDAATKKYVDDAVTAQGLMPAKFRWLYQPGSSNLLGPNRFILYDDFLRMGPTPHNNQSGDFSAMVSSDSGAHSISTFGSIYSWSSSAKIFTVKRFFKITNYRFGFARSGEINHLEFEIDWPNMVSNGSLGTASQYYITIGGLF